MRLHVLFEYEGLGTLETGRAYARRGAGGAKAPGGDVQTKEGQHRARVSRLRLGIHQGTEQGTKKMIQPSQDRFWNKISFS